MPPARPEAARRKPLGPPRAGKLTFGPSHASQNLFFCVSELWPPFLVPPARPEAAARELLSPRRPRKLTLWTVACFAKFVFSAFGAPSFVSTATAFGGTRRCEQTCFRALEGLANFFSNRRMLVKIWFCALARIGLALWRHRLGQRQADASDCAF